MFRVIALIAVYNEERFIRNCLENFFNQGIDVYLLDNCSEDRTVEIAREYLDKGLINIETFPREEYYYIEKIWNRKAELGFELDADWFIHSDADEIRLSFNPQKTLRESLYKLDQEGYNAVNYQEFTFIPTIESPNHDHCDYIKTMQWYYPFLPTTNFGLNTWKKQPDQIKLTSHSVDFPGLNIFPESFKMKHYFYLSIDHAIKKWCRRKYPEEVLKRGLHVQRAKLNPSNISLVSKELLREYKSDDELDSTNPYKKHFLFLNF